MSYPISVLPDDELAIVQYLRTVSQVTALVPGVRITTEMPNKPTYPLVLITRGGGQAAAWQALDEPMHQIDTYGNSKKQAKDVMAAVRASILAIANDTVPEAVLVSAYEEVGPAWLPDTVTVPPTPRYMAHFRVFLHK